MSVLSSLKLVSAKRPTQMPSVQIRRNKLVGKLHHQLMLAQAIGRGESYAPLRLRSVRDRNTQEVKRLEMPTKVRQWWFTSETGSIVLQIRYGAKVIDLSKGKNSIEIADGSQLIKTLESVREAVLGGELDAQIESAANVVKSRFKK